MLSRKQIGYLIHWGIIIFIVYCIIFLFPRFIFEVFIIGGLAFIIGLILRILKLYPGEKEPLILDLSSSIIAFLIAFWILFLGNGNVFILILKIGGPLIVLIPHIIYIIYRIK